MVEAQDRIEVSIENLHKIQEEKRKAQEAKKAELTAKTPMSGIMRGLTLTKSKSILLEDPVVQSRHSRASLHEGGQKPIDFSHFKDKEER